MRTYLNMLIESLEKKCELLDRIASCGEQQMTLTREENFDMETFDRLMDEKLAHAARIDKLDEGFENVYDRIRQEVLTNKEAYAEEIRTLQKLISQITEKNTSIQASEMRLKLAAENAVRREGNALRQKRSSTKAVQNYYQNMRRVNYVDSQFLDRRN